MKHRMKHSRPATRRLAVDSRNRETLGINLTFVER
jgi:hypothetical protein